MGNNNTFKTDYTVWHIDGVDVNDGLKRFMNKADRYEKALKSFAVNLEEDIRKLERPLSEEDYRQARDHIHKIKGVSGNLGAKNLYSASLELERRLSEGVFDDNAFNNLLQYAKEFELSIMNAFGAEKESQGNSAEPAAREKDAVLQLTRLKQSAEDFNPDASDKIAEELKQTHWGLWDGEIKSVCGLIEDYKYDEAIKIINRLLGYKGEK